MLWRKRREQQRPGPAAGPGSVAQDGGDSSVQSSESDQALAACADILAWCGIAVSEISDAAAPFLTVQQRASLRAQATNFQSLNYQSTAIIEQPVQAVPPTAVLGETPAAVAGDALSRDEVEAAVNHRVEIGVQEALAQLGVAPGSSIRDEVERQVEVQLATQEHRLLEYVKRHLTDSLEMLERGLSDRLGQVLEGKSELAEAQAEIDAQVEGTREALLRQIEEVRTVDVGFNIDSYAAELAGVANVEIEEEIILDDSEVELDLGEAEEELVELAGAEPEEAAAKKAEEEAAAKKAEEEAAAKKDKPIIAEVMAEEEAVQINLMPAPGQDMTEIYLDDPPEKLSDGDSKQGDGITLDLDEDDEEEEVGEEDINAAVAHYTREGDLAMGKNRFEGALVSYDSAIKVAPEDGELYFKRALAYRASGDLKKAFLDLMKARDLKPDIPDIRNHLTETRKALKEAEAGAKGAN